MVERKGNNKETKLKNPGHIVNILILGAMTAMGFAAIVRQDGIILFTAVLGVILSLIPYALEKKWTSSLPWSFFLMLSVPNFLHVAGVYFNLYGAIKIYDKILHFFTPMILAFIAIVIIYLLDKYSKRYLKLSLGGMIFVTIVTTMAICMFWEILEFIFDQLFGTEAQPGLYDTMFDLILGALAGVVVGIGGAFFIRRDDPEEKLGDVEKKAADIISRKEGEEEL